MKKLTTGKIWQFAAGQFGWAMLSGIISNWLVYFYQPDEAAISQGQTVFIPQGLAILGININAVHKAVQLLAVALNSQSFDSAVRKINCKACHILIG